MRRGVVIALSVMGVLVVILAVALATIGTGLDEARIEQEDLQFQVDELEQERETLTEERDRLKNELEVQRKAHDGLKAELDRVRADAKNAVASPAPAAPEAPAASP